MERKNNVTGVFFTSIAMIFIFGLAQKYSKYKKIVHFELRHRRIFDPDFEKKWKLSMFKTQLDLEGKLIPKFFDAKVQSDLTFRIFNLFGQVQK